MYLHDNSCYCNLLMLTRFCILDMLTELSMHSFIACRFFLQNLTTPCDIDGPFNSW